jgi:hypothetical protein
MNRRVSSRSTLPLTFGDVIINAMPSRSRRADRARPCRGFVPARILEAMDPYHTLGVPRRCTREEVKEAFRARAWRAHPDRGGEESSFIQFCTAYKQILEDLDRNPGSSALKPAWTPRAERAPKPPDPRWEPDLIVLAKPPDPRWKPDLIMLDESAPQPHPAAAEPRLARESYEAWLQRVAAESQRRTPLVHRRWVRAVGIILILGMTLFGIVMCGIVWYQVGQMEAQAHREAEYGWSGK